MADLRKSIPQSNIDTALSVRGGDGRIVVALNVRRYICSLLRTVVINRNPIPILQARKRLVVELFVTCNLHLYSEMRYAHIRF